MTNRLCSSNSRCKGAQCDTTSALRWYRNRCLCNLPSVDMVVADLYFKTAIHHGKAWPGEVCLQLGMIVGVSMKACEFFTNARRCCCRYCCMYTPNDSSQALLFSSFLYDIPPTLYRIGTVLVTPHVVHHAAKAPSPYAGRASLNHRREVCVFGQTRRASVIRKLVCSYHPTGGEFAIRLK